jgi:hypothetical protein
MRTIFSLTLALAAISGCADEPPQQPTSSTEGTTVVRTAVVTRVTPPASAGAPTRLELRYDNGATAVVEATTSEIFKAGDKVRVTHARGTERIERLDAR